MPLVEPIFFFSLISPNPIDLRFSKDIFKNHVFVYFSWKHKHGRVLFPKALIVAAIVTNSPRSRGVRDPIGGKKNLLNW